MSRRLYMNPFQNRTNRQIKDIMIEVTRESFVSGREKWLMITVVVRRDRPHAAARTRPRLHVRGRQDGGWLHRAGRHWHSRCAVTAASRGASAEGLVTRACPQLRHFAVRFVDAGEGETSSTPPSSLVHV